MQLYIKLLYRLFRKGEDNAKERRRRNVRMLQVRIADTETFLLAQCTMMVPTEGTRDPLANQRNKGKKNKVQVSLHLRRLGDGRLWPPT